MLQSKKSQLTGRQKAAIFLVSLGSDVSSEIFKHLREDEIEQLTFEIARLDKIEPEDKDRVLQEFQEMMMAQEFHLHGRHRLRPGGAGKGPGHAEGHRYREQAHLDPPGEALRLHPQHRPEPSLNFIQGEHPQTIALILAYLDPQQGGPDPVGSQPPDTGGRGEAHRHDGPDLAGRSPRG